MTNLQFIEKFTIQNSTSAFSCDNVLTDAYDIYCIVSKNIKLVGTTQTNLSMRFLDSSGNAITGANDYGYAVRSTPANTSFVNSTDGSGSLILNAFGKDDGNEGASAVIYLFNPANASEYTYGLFQSIGDNGTNVETYKGICLYPTQASVRGFQVLETASRPFDEGSISVYGVR